MAGCPSGSRESSAKGMSASSNLVPASFFNYFVMLRSLSICYTTGHIEEDPLFLRMIYLPEP